MTENSDASSKKLQVGKNKLRRRRNVVEKSQSQSKKFDAIDVGLYNYTASEKLCFVLLYNEGRDVSVNAHVVGQMGAAAGAIFTRQHHLCRQE